MANAKPRANAVFANGVEDASPIVIALTASDGDGSIGFFRLSKLPVGGQLFLDTAMMVPVALNTSYVGMANALALYFQPNPDFAGTATFSYIAIDALGAVSGKATGTITVAPVDDAPVAISVAVSGREDTTFEVTFKATDIDGKVASYKLETLPANGVLFFDQAGTILVSAGEVIPVSTKVFFKPGDDFNGSSNFHFSAIDDIGVKSAGTATATIQISPINDAPLASAVTVTGGIGSTIPVTLTADDVDGTVAKFQITKIPSKAAGTLYLDAGLTIAVKAGAVLSAAGEALTLYFKPGPVAVHSAAFQYLAIDDSGAKSGKVSAEISLLSTHVIDLKTLGPEEGFVIRGGVFSELGWSVASAGDLNGDGRPDLLVGDPRSFRGSGGVGGEAFVVFGSDSYGEASDQTGRFIILVDEMSTEVGLRLYSEVFGDLAGNSVSTAGDLNADGYSDLIIGAPYEGGVAYVLLGKNSPFINAVDLDGREFVGLNRLEPSEGFVISDDLAGHLTGWSVSSAGDFNGDGFSDLIIGAPASPDGAGDAYVVFGKAGVLGVLSAAGRWMLDLSEMAPSAGFTIRGDGTHTQAGSSVSLAGDLNGDGYADLIIGAPDIAPTGSGASYVLFGRAEMTGLPEWGGRAVVDLHNVPTQQFTAGLGFVILGDTSGEDAGWSVSSAGDFNADGYADLIIGAPGSGKAYVVFGKSHGFGSTDIYGRAVVDLANISSSFTALQGFVIQGGAHSDSVGLSVSTAGDVNGDGFGDLIVGAPFNDTGGADAGAAYVIFGGATAIGRTDATGRAVLELDSLKATEGIVILGDKAGARAGFSVAWGGDVNSDGFSDVIVGAPRGNPGNAFVVFGGAYGASALPVTAEGTSGGEVFVGSLGNDFLVGSGGRDAFHAGAGDDWISIADPLFLIVDGGSGTDTLAFTGSGVTFNLADRNVASHIEGIERFSLVGSGTQTLKLDRLAVLSEATAGPAGDHIVIVQGSVDDKVILNDVQWQQNGSILDHGVRFDRYVNGDAEVRIQQGVTVSFPDSFAWVTTTQGFIIQGSVPSDFAGFSVSSAGDINGDGLADIVVGAPQAQEGGINAGSAYVVFGQRPGFGRIDELGRAVVSLKSLSPDEGFVVQGGLPFDVVGLSVGSAGDVNGDGFSDLIVGSPGDDDGGANSGAAYVLFGKASQFGTIAQSGRAVVNIAYLAPSDGFLVKGDDLEDNAGWSVDTAGDINGDGLSDIIIGARQAGATERGQSYVVFGKSSGFGTLDSSGRAVIDISSLSSTSGFVIQGARSGDDLGWNVSTLGDVNGDGLSDLIVGAPFNDDGGQDAGAAYVLFGRRSGFGIADAAGRAVVDVGLAQTFAPDRGFVIRGYGTQGQTGYKASAAGDINGDGFSDVIVSGDFVSGVGEAFVVFGTASGFGGVDSSGRSIIDLSNGSSTFAQDKGFLIRGGAEAHIVGVDVSTAGDFNGDGFDDVIVGAYGVGGESTAYVLFGKPTGFGSVDASGRRVFSIDSFGPSDGFIVGGEDRGGDAGVSVAVAGDVNGDGFSDLIVGVRGIPGFLGESYVLFGGALGASNEEKVLYGTSGVNMLAGGVGDDTLVGGGGADILRAGAGDDTLVVTDMSFRLVDGGLGTDTLRFLGAGATFDFTNLAAERVSGIEAIDIAGSGNSRLILRAGDVFDMSDTVNEYYSGATSHNSLVVLGNLGDQLQLIGFDPDGVGGLAPATWIRQASHVNLSRTDVGQFDLFDLVRDGLHLASVAVSSDVAVDTLTTHTLLI